MRKNKFFGEKALRLGLRERFSSMMSAGSCACLLFIVVPKDLADWDVGDVHCAMSMKCPQVLGITCQPHFRLQSDVQAYDGVRIWQHMCPAVEIFTLQSFFLSLIMFFSRHLLPSPAFHPYMPDCKGHMSPTSPAVIFSQVEIRCFKQVPRYRVERCHSQGSTESRHDLGRAIDHTDVTGGSLPTFPSHPKFMLVNG